MADMKNMPNGNGDSSCFKEAVCIDTGRIYDSCSDKDCLEDLQVYFTDCAQEEINNAINIKPKKVEVLSVFMDVEPVPFNRGFYSVDMTFFFRVRLDVFNAAVCSPSKVDGVATFSKKVILYGSEGNVKTFASDNPQMHCTCGEFKTKLNMPKAIVQVVDPILLAGRLCEIGNCCCDNCISIPSSICQYFDGSFDNARPIKTVKVTIGLFSIVQLERSVQMIVPAYDFCIPDKECVTTSEDPCELFKKIKFPTNEFFPPRLSDLDCDDEPARDCDCD